MVPRQKYFALANHKDAKDFIELVGQIKTFLEAHEKFEYCPSDVEVKSIHPNLTDEQYIRWGMLKNGYKFCQSLIENVTV